MGNHTKFQQHLSNSKYAVSKAAEWFTSRGYSVQIPSATVAETHQEWKSHADSGDLFLLHRIEVKRLSVDFTSRADWPYSDKFIVCAKHSWDRATPKPHAYLIFNAQMTHVAIVKGESRTKWNSERRKDSRYEGREAEQEFYFCPLDAVLFLKV